MPKSAWTSSATPAAIPAPTVQAVRDATSLRGIGISATAPADGQALVYNAASGLWLPGTVSSGGSSGLGYTIWDPDYPPSSASAYDDEFLATALNSKWTVVNGSNFTRDQATTVPYALSLVSTATSSSMVALLQAIPTGDFTIFGKIRLEPNTSATTASIGLILSTTNTTATGSQLITSSSSYGSSAAFSQTYTYTNFTTANSGAAVQQKAPVYIRIRRVGTAYYAGCSADGITWSDAAVTPSGTPAYFGLFALCTAGSMRASVDFFRYLANGVATTLTGQARS